MGGADPIATPTAILEYTDSSGSGAPDGYVSVEISELGRSDVDGTVVRRIVETRATDIGLDGTPRHMHVQERVVAAPRRGAALVLSVQDRDVAPTREGPQDMTQAARQPARSSAPR
jgi:hypothetical protein